MEHDIRIENSYGTYIAMCSCGWSVPSTTFDEAYEWVDSHKKNGF